LKANYWIVALDENYQWAVVSEPKHKDFWILSRVPVMGNDEFQHVLEIVKNNGFDLQKVEIVPQNCR
jgi:apolipoprotein D and lipocalin family protein